MPLTRLSSVLFPLPLRPEQGDELTLGEVGGGIFQHDTAAVAFLVGLGKADQPDERGRSIDSQPILGAV